MPRTQYYFPGDKVADIFSTKHGIVEEARTSCSGCALHPCPLSTRNGDDGCVFVRLVGGMLVQREPRELSKKTYGG